MKLVEVNDKKSTQEFLMLPVRLYKESEYWIRPLDKDVHAVFDPAKNKSFRHGECIRWILQGEGGKTIGRVAAFYNKKSLNKDNDQPTGGMGFFECEDDKEAAFMLFDACKKWLETKGVEAMDGPINFGERDRWWGLLVDGFDYEPNYTCNYHHPYYQQLFEEYGFQLYFRQFTYARKVLDPLSPKLSRKAAIVAQDKSYTFEHIRLKNLAKYSEDFREIYNKAWAAHPGVPKMSSLQANSIITQLKPIMNEKILWFGYYDNQPIAFFLILPEVNQIFKHVNGKLDLIGKLKFLYHKWRKTTKKIIGIVFGVVPEFQGKGVDGAIIMEMRKVVQDDYPIYEDFEMNWIGDFNPKMLNVVEQVGGFVSKTHITYRYLFDRTKPFKRMPIKE
ncbi:hypothetical protein R9C00_11545 [Flammeovirgaceae bacterium SG7u.111]|nr:hypothetical protein [Flammeovirgaceae bacterium SG7u.132]WPO38086.1 hypothetical protein R9C00_11545 [Flammeovirgaceae bacterium SG7u.111]